MIKPSSFVFRQIRNMKRNPTVMNHSGSKDLISSAKDIKHARSHKQIDVANFLENKNEKIKNIDEKLEVHQSEINRNNDIIQELNSNFISLKEQLEKEKEVATNEERKNRLLREDIQRTNKLLKVKNAKIQQFSRKLAELERDNESFRNIAAKYDQHIRTISHLRSKIVHGQELISDLKSSIGEKDRELHRHREKVANYEILKAREEDLNGQVLMKDLTIGNLKQTINQLHQEKSQQASERNNNQRKIERLTEEIQLWKVREAKLNSSIEHSHNKYLEMKEKCEGMQSALMQEDGKLRDKEREEQERKKVYSQLKDKLNKLEGDYGEAIKQSSKKDLKIDKLMQKIKELENNCGQNMKEKERLRQMEDRLENLKRKGQTLQSLYYTIVPQIQCPFGHELQNPVTIIPCGHSYCLGCKKGYQKECMQCCGKLKIEAVYRNELMDDIMGMVGGIKQVIQLLK